MKTAASALDSKVHVERRADTASMLKAKKLIATASDKTASVVTFPLRSAGETASLSMVGNAGPAD
jgi:hypothetical protein